LPPKAPQIDGCIVPKTSAVKKTITVPAGFIALPGKINTNLRRIKKAPPPSNNAGRLQSKGNVVGKPECGECLIKPSHPKFGRHTTKDPDKPASTLAAIADFTGFLMHIQRKTASPQNRVRPKSVRKNMICERVHPNEIKPQFYPYRLE